MKKIISLLIAMLLVTGSYAAKKTDAVSTAHQDVEEAIAVAHEDVVGTLTTVYQDGKDVISTIYGDSKELAGNLYPEVKSAVIAIAKAIGVAAEHVYTVLVKKFVVDAIVQLLPFLLGLLLIGIAWFKMSGYFKAHEKIEWHILYPCTLLVAGIVALSCVDYNVMVIGLVNPEYGALNYILEYSKEMLK
jgi:hypothetical protein